MSMNLLRTVSFRCLFRFILSCVLSTPLFFIYSLFCLGFWLSSISLLLFNGSCSVDCSASLSIFLSSCLTFPFPLHFSSHSHFIFTFNLFFNDYQQLSLHCFSFPGYRFCQSTSSFCRRLSRRHQISLSFRAPLCRRLFWIDGFGIVAVSRICR